MVVGSLLEGGGCGCVGCWFGRGWLWGWWWAFVVWLEDLWVRGAGQGSSILPSVARSSQVLRARGGRRGRGRLGRLVRFGIGVELQLHYMYQLDLKKLHFLYLVLLFLS